MIRSGLLLLCVPLLAQDAQLALMRSRMNDNVRRQPNYTCLETIERSRTLGGGGVQMSDRLRLEVALVDGKEMFAWPGSGEFEDVTVRDLVQRGTFGSGNFALYARVLFGSRYPQFGPVESVMLGQRSALRWQYRVGRESGGIQLLVGEKAAVVGFRGAIYADANTLDVLKLEVIADDAPASLGSYGSEDSVEYARVPIGEESFLLPVSSQLVMQLSGRADINRVTFSGCRKFAGESTILFETVDEGPAAAVPPVAITPVTLVKDLKVDLEITTDINFATAAAGDEVRALLRNGLEWDGHTRVPRGAIAKGRITRLELHPEGTLLGIQFHELNWPGGRAELMLRFEDAHGVGRNWEPKYYIYETQRYEAVMGLRSRGALPRGARLTWRTDP